jgi:hypothetical protein
MPAKKTSPADERRKEVLEFLGRDFGEAFNELREYDARIWDVTKFTFGELLVSIGAVWTIFSIATGQNPPGLLANRWELVGAIILIVSFLFSFLAVQVILRTRTYFVTTARYINAQRHFFFYELKPPVYPDLTKYYTRINEPKFFDFDSTELWSVYFIILVSSAVFGFGIGLLAHYLTLPGMPAFLLGAGVFLAASILEIVYASRYLSKKEK